MKTQTHTHSLIQANIIMCVWVPMRETYINYNCMQLLHTATVCSFFNFVYFPHWLWLRLRIQAPPSLGLTMGMCECAGSYGYGSMAMHHKKVNVLKRLKNSNFVDFCAFFFAPNCKKENILRFKNAWFLLEKNTTFAYAENRVDLMDDDKQQRRRHITEMLVQTCIYT